MSGLRKIKWSLRIWGGLRISQELALIGINVSDEAVRNILRSNGFIPPRTRFTPIKWGTFFSHHKHIWQIDLTSVFDSQGLQIFIFAAIDFESRTLVSINATLNPTRDWIIQQICNASVVGFELPTAVIADNDGVYGKWLERDFKKYFGIEVFRTPYRQPWKNGRIERYFRSIKDEIFHRLDVVDVFHARELCTLYQEYYNGYRPHQSKNGLPPKSVGQVQSIEEPFKMSSIRKIKVADGLITRYELAA
jgi:putative transposase